MYQRPCRVLIFAITLLWFAAYAAPTSSTPAPQAPTSTAPPVHGHDLLDPSRGFPRAVLFRVAVETAARRGDPQEWVLALAEHYDMVIAKALDDEIIGLQKAAP